MDGPITLRDALLEAQVQHELAKLRDELVPARIAAGVRELFLWMQGVRLDDVSCSAQIAGIIERCAIELRVGGGIVELMGEVGQLVLSSPTGQQTRLNEVLPDSSYELFAAKVAQLSVAWRDLIERITRSEAGELLQTELLTWALNDLLHTRSAPVRVQQVVLGLEARLARAVAKRLRKAVTGERRADLLNVLDPELLRSVADEVWISVSSLPLRQLFALIETQDLDDFIVLGHEFWLGYRKSPYFQRLMLEIVEHFFQKYGAQSLAAIVDDMGVSETLVAQELAALVAPIVARAVETGFAERQLRAQLRTFYESPAFVALLPLAAD